MHKETARLYLCEKVKWAASVPINDGSIIVSHLNELVK